jgi:hypothetical protein
VVVPQVEGLEFEVALWTGVIDLLKRRKKKIRFVIEIFICDKDKVT